MHCYQYCHLMRKKDLIKEQANTVITETESSLASDWDNKGVIKGNRMVSIVRQSCVVCGWPSIIMMLFIPHKRIVGEKQLGQIRVTVILCIDFKRFSSKQQIKVVLSDRLRRPNTKLAGLGETSSVPVFLRGRKPSSFKLFSSIQPLRMSIIQ